MQQRFLLQILLLVQHVSGTTMPVVLMLWFSSCWSGVELRVMCPVCSLQQHAHHQELKSIIQWLLTVVFSAVVFKLLVWCGVEGYVSGLQVTAACPSSGAQEYYTVVAACGISCCAFQVAVLVCS